MGKLWAIINKEDKNLFWNNQWGWIDLDEDPENEIDIFTEEQTIGLDLPIEGEWFLL